MSCKLTINEISKERWERYAQNFADYSIYQTWGYQQVRAENDRQELCRVIIRDGDRPVTICQVRIKNAKSLGLRIGYIQWGPLLRIKDGSVSCTVDALVELKRALIGQRANVLRVVPNVCDDEMGRQVAGMFENAGFGFIKSVPPYHTMMLPLNCSVDVLRSRLHQSWRRKLKKAENAGIEMQETTDGKFFEVLETYYREMVNRKNFKGLEVREFARSQQLLSPAERMNVIAACYQGRPVTVHITSAIGDTGVALLVASSEKGFECCASYLAWWRAITGCLSRGMKRYDVGGVDFEKNPTVSQFKTGLGGTDCHYIGAFEACDSSSTKIMWRIAEKAYSYIRDK